MVDVKTSCQTDFLKEDIKWVECLFIVNRQMGDYVLLKHTVKMSHDHVDFKLVFQLVIIQPVPVTNPHEKSVLEKASFEITLVPVVGIGRFFEREILLGCRAITWRISVAMAGEVWAHDKKHFRPSDVEGAFHSIKPYL